MGGYSFAVRALATILRDNWHWRRQIRRLAVFDLIKRTRGTVLRWGWLFVKPLVFIFMYWFALDIGLRAGRDMDPPFYLWLVIGLIPWFCMREMLSTGSDVFHRYTYLINKMRFPISGLSTVFSCSSFIVHFGLLIVLFALYFFMGRPIDIYLLQLLLIIPVMFIFFFMYSLMTSLVSALSKDFANLIKAFVTPLFWLSGVIFDVSRINIQWIQSVLLFNPITFFVTAYRDTFYYKAWIWDDPIKLIAFGLVFIFTLFTMLILYKRLAKEVPDVIG